MRGAAGNFRVGWGQLLVMLALIAVATRALVPQGYMFAAARDGHLLEVTICTGTLAESGAIDLRTGEIVKSPRSPEKPSHDPKQGAGSPCVFASAAPLTAPLVGPAWRIDAPRRFVVLGSGAERAVILGLIAPPPPPTGPPSAV